MTTPDQRPRKPDHLTNLAGAFGDIRIGGRRMPEHIKPLLSLPPSRKKPGGGVRPHTPEELAEIRERAYARTAAFAAEVAHLDDAAAHMWEEIRLTCRRNRYAQGRPSEYAESSLGRLLPQQNPGGKGSGWLDSGAKIGLLSGPSGHGKTDLSYAIGNEAIERGIWVEAWSVVELVQVLAPLPVHARKDEVRSARQENVFDAAKECELLILDDLGAEEGGGFVAERWRSQLLDLLTARDTNRDRRTIVTLNGGSTLDQPDEAAKTAVKTATFNRLAEHYDTRVATRLRRDMVGIWVEGECLRKISTWNPF